jgi:hypothetical protein
MKKQIITDINESKVYDTEYHNGDSPIDIYELIQFLTISKENGATSVKITGSGQNGEIEYIVIQSVQVKIESDDDYNKRVAEEESRRLAKENVEKARGKALYEELKAKYGD